MDDYEDAATARKRRLQALMIETYHHLISPWAYHPAERQRRDQVLLRTPVVTSEPDADRPGTSG